MDIKLKMELNLQHIALIQVAANIWLSHQMITKISNFVTRNDINYYKSSADAKFRMKIREWLTDIFEQVDTMELPSTIKKDLWYVMRPVGENLLEYLGRTSIKWSHLYRESLFPGLDVYYKHIEFDCIGRVDEVKTFLNIYNANENVSLLFLFDEACTYCLEDVIHSIWNKCSEQMKFKIRLFLSSNLGLDRNDMHRIQQYWLQLVDKSQLKLPFEFTVTDAFEYCADKANTAGVKYFINKLSQDDKNKIIVPLAEKILKQRFEKRVTPMILRRDGTLQAPSLMHILVHPIGANQHTFNLFYLLTQMTKDEKNKFSISCRTRIVLLLIKEWPWKYLVLNLDYVNKETYYWMIKSILEAIVDDYNCYKKIVYTDLWMISEIWKKNPNRFKESIVEICWSIKKSIMFKLQAVILVTSVIYDTNGVNKLRSEICNFFEIYCNEFIDQQKYEVVDLYLKNLLQHDKERKSYIKNYYNFKI